MKRHWHGFTITGGSLALLIGTAACSTESRRETTIDACALLEKSEVEAALGGDVTPGERNDSGLLTDGAEAGVYSSTCVWRAVGAQSPGGASLDGVDYVIVNAMQWPPEKDPEAFLQTFRDFAAQGVIAHDPVPLAIGDAALWWGDGVAVAKDRTSYGISVRLVGEREKRRIAEEALAKTIALRL